MLVLALALSGCGGAVLRDDAGPGASFDGWPEPTRGMDPGAAAWREAAGAWYGAAAAWDDAADAWRNAGEAWSQLERDIGRGGCRDADCGNAGRRGSWVILW